VATSPRLFDTVSGDLFNGCGSLSADGDTLALLRFHSNLVYQNGATHNPAILTPFGPSRASFQTGRSPTTSRLAPKRVPRMGFPLSVPHVASLDSPIGEWDRRCRVCSDSRRLSLYQLVRHSVECNPQASGGLARFSSAVFAQNGVLSGDTTEGGFRSLYCSLLNFAVLSLNRTQSRRNPNGQQHVSG